MPYSKKHFPGEFKFVEGRDTFDRQLGETPKAWSAFTKYRDMGPKRSIAKTAEMIGVAADRLARWSSRNEWVRRAADWERHQGRQKATRRDGNADVHHGR